MSLESAQEVVRKINAFCKGREWFRVAVPTMQSDRSYCVAINIHSWGKITLAEQFELFDAFKEASIHFRAVLAAPPYVPKA